MNMKKKKISEKKSYDDKFREFLKKKKEEKPKSSFGEKFAEFKIKHEKKEEQSSEGASAEAEPSEPKSEEVKTEESKSEEKPKDVPKEEPKEIEKKAPQKKEESKPKSETPNILSKFYNFLFRIKTDSKIEKVEKELKKSDEKDAKREEEDKKEEKKKFLTNLEIIKKKKKKKIKLSRYEHRRHLQTYLEKAGYNVSEESNVSSKVNIVVASIVGIFTLYILYAGVVRGDRFLFILTQVVSAWIIIFPALIVAFWIIFYYAIDFKIYKRKKQLELVLPDFLQLTSANLNAGMPLDQALWYAVRPRFGVLAKEIEDVAKSTLVGEELKDALVKFSKRYDSQMLKRTVNLMLEGLDAGGEIGPLLSKISTDIQESYIIRRDMSANVTTYVIFITFATVVAAPFLFALSSQLLDIIQSLVSNINIPNDVASNTMISFNMGEASITPRDFKIFAISALAMTSFFSAVIVSIIQKGNVKDGIKYIPAFIIISIIIFIIASKILGYFLGGMI